MMTLARLSSPKAGLEPSRCRETLAAAQLTGGSFTFGGYRPTGAGGRRNHIARGYHPRSFAADHR
ncbi:hypothetical protein LRC484719_13750 [Mycobacterium riyadhense]